MINKKNKNIIHYPYASGAKASQVNYAIKKTKGIFLDDYVVIFDADSKPDLEMFNFVSKDTDSPPLYQSFSKYTSKINLVSNLSKANAVYQTRWTYTFEASNMIKNYYLNKRKFMYLISHGLFIRKDIYNNNMLPEQTITEDIVYGYKLNLKKIIPKPLPFFDYCTVPNDLITTIRQSGRWFSGELNIFKLADFKNNFFNSLDRLTYFLQWIFGPPIILLTLIITALNNNWILFITMFIILITFIFFLHIKIIKMEKIKFPFYYLFIKGITDCFGPFYALGNILIKKIRNKKLEFEKTSR